MLVASTLAVAAQPSAKILVKTEDLLCVMQNASTYIEKAEATAGVVLIFLSRCPDNVPTESDIDAVALDPNIASGSIESAQTIVSLRVDELRCLALPEVVAEVSESEGGQIDLTVLLDECKL